MADLQRVTSLQNALVKHARFLDRRKERKERGEFLAEGAKVIATARDRGWAPETLFVADSEGKAGIVPALIDWARKAGATCVSINDKLAEALSARDNPQALIGVFKQRWSAAPKNPAAGEVWVALEEIRDPGNLGTIVRTVDAVGAKGVILVGTCCDPYARDAVRASMGSIFSVPLAAMSRDAFLAWRKGWPGEVVGTHLSAREDFRRPYRTPVLLMMGSEGPGLSDDLTRSATTLVKIPMASGGADSLNLAVATGLVLFEVARPQ
jgi:TrmH family RNA methyltransferase